MSEYNPHDAIHYIFEKAPEFAKAKGELAQLETFKHSLKAIKMAQADQSSMTAKEMEAYRSPEYQELCKAIGQATEQVEKLKWQLEAAKMRFQAWQTESANNRQIERMTT
jgi:predicted RNase H-like nuclease (RuvC/YqgF family)